MLPAKNIRRMLLSIFFHLMSCIFTVFGIFWAFWSSQFGGLWTPHHYTAGYQHVRKALYFVVSYIALFLSPVCWPPTGCVLDSLTASYASLNISFITVASQSPWSSSWSPLPPLTSLHSLNQHCWTTQPTHWDPPLPRSHFFLCLPLFTFNS